MELVEDLTKEIDRMSAGGKEVPEIMVRVNEIVREHNRRMLMHLWFQGLLDGKVSA